MAVRLELTDMLQRVLTSQPELMELEAVVVKELLHYEILWSLERKGILRQLAFHGGTALRLCYGAPRMSEDLDFAGGAGFTRNDVDGMAEAARLHLVSRYGLEVAVKEPKPRKKNSSMVAVDTWQITVITSPRQSHRPRQRIKIDIATMEARKTELQPVQKYYSVLPSGIAGLLVPVMSSEEILANNLVSLPDSVNRNRIRYRDIWDIAWLTLQNVPSNHELVAARVEEFGMTDYGDRVERMCMLLTEPTTQERFSAEMGRFLPRSAMVQTMDRPDFISFVVKRVSEQLTKVRSVI